MFTFTGLSQDPIITCIVTVIVAVLIYLALLEYIERTTELNELQARWYQWTWIFVNATCVAFAAILFAAYFLM